MKQKKERSKHYILKLIILVVVDILIIWGGTVLDTWLYPLDRAPVGHPFPVFTLLAVGVAALISIIVVIKMIASAIKGTSQKKQKD